MHPGLPVLSLKNMEAHLDESAEFWLVRVGAYIFAIFAVVALFLASIGVYGVRAYNVVSRTHEIGIRMAVGASVRQVLWLVLSEGLNLSALGVGVGLVLAGATSTLLSSFLYRVSATDPLVFGTAAFLLSAIALLACYFPARRAASVDPIVALRYE